MVIVSELGKTGAEGLKPLCCPGGFADCGGLLGPIWRLLSCPFFAICLIISRLQVFLRAFRFGEDHDFL